MQALTSAMQEPNAELNQRLDLEKCSDILLTNWCRASTLL